MYLSNREHIILFINIITISYVSSTLQLVHVLFRHGERTTDASTIYPKDPYINETYYPYGLGELTNKGKKTEYTIGKSLRAEYDEFLGGTYTPDVLEAWSSDVNRTKASLQLVLAGLFPPLEEQIWETGLNWQPIPFKTRPRNEDKLIMGVLCPNYLKAYDKQVASKRFRRVIKQNFKLFYYLTENTGWVITDYWNLFYIYMCLSTEKEYGFPLPSWSKKVYPQPLKNFAIESYSFNTATTEMKRLASGYLLKKIIDDSIAKANGEIPNKKIFLYSAHELNVAHMLITLDVFERAIPPYGSYIVFELHKIDDVFGFKIFYEDYRYNYPRLLKLPACDYFCPLDDFTVLMEEYFPDETSCGTE